MTAGETLQAIEATFRIERNRLIAGLARLVRDIDRAEELAQDALVIALSEWPRSGVPANPGAWLMTAAKRRAIDEIRRDAMRTRKHQEIARELDGAFEDVTEAIEASMSDDLGDERLGLLFTACHPMLSADARAALTLRVVGGLTTDEIARAFLVPEPTIAQRIVRAKRTLADEHVPFELPSRAERAGRVASVLEVIYLVFNEGYSATAGDDWTRPALCEEAMRLARILAQLSQDTAEVHGLVALLEIQASRMRARLDSEGKPILLMAQDRSRWDQLLIGRGLAALARAEQIEDEPGPYQLQAAIAACHARARTPEATDWDRIVALYGELMTCLPSPVVELNRAVAVSMASGPAAALLLVDGLVTDGHLARYHLLHAARGDLLARLDRHAEARTEFERAAAMTANEREKALLFERARDARSR